MDTFSHHPMSAATTTVLGVLSVASGALLLAVPEQMGRLYALPLRRGLLRLLGARDLAIGGSMLYPASRRAASTARLLSDLVDVALIAVGARSHGRRVSDVRGRIVGGLLSAAVAAYSRRAARATG